MNERHDVHTSLAEMDRKLRELQHELAQVAQHPRPAPAPAPSSAFSTPAPQPLPQPSPYAVPSPGVPTAPVPPAFAPAPSAAAPVAGPPSNAVRMVQEAAARLVVMSRQIDELQRARDELQRSLSVLAAEYDVAPATAPPAPATTALPTPTYPPQVTEPPPAAAGRGAPLAPVENRPAVEPGPFAPAAPPEFSTQSARAGSLSGVSPPVEGASNRNQFEGQVVINAGPFTDIATLGAFEQALGRVPHAEEVYVRGFEGNRALIDLRLGGPVRLLDEMRQWVPFPFDVAEMGHGMITINVEASAGQGNPAVTLR